jgi:hypothetical protein
MRGSRVRALRRQFKVDNGRAPLGSSVKREIRHINQPLGPPTPYLYMKVLRKSEWRAQKRAYKRKMRNRQS